MPAGSACEHRKPVEERETGMINRIKYWSLAGSLALVCLAVLPSVTKAETIYNVNRKGIAIKGHDPVGYFTMSEPVNGKQEFAAQYGGATWHFANAGNRETFLENPEKYVPRYGGYCAYGVAEGGLFNIATDAWTIHDGRLYLNQNKRVRKLWLENIPGHIRQADLLWPKIQKLR
jgi:YHS domain-containing protein